MKWHKTSWPIASWPQTLSVPGLICSFLSMYIHHFVRTCKCAVMDYRADTQQSHKPLWPRSIQPLCVSFTTAYGKDGMRNIHWQSNWWYSPMAIYIYINTHIHTVCVLMPPPFIVHTQIYKPCLKSFTHSILTTQGIKQKTGVSDDKIKTTLRTFLPSGLDVFPICANFWW